MKTNYHTHTFRCNHAEPDERKYLDTAIENGFKVFGFADHTPNFFDGDYYSTFRMRPELAKDYFDTLFALKEEYKDKLEIHVGLEAEYYPKYFDKLLALARENGCEYFILGQHFLGNETDAPYSGSATDDKERLTKYVNQTSEAMATGLYTYFAHPDLINYRGDKAFYCEEMTRLCENAKKANMPLEFNLLGFFENRAYPYMTFWKEVVAKVGNDVILGCDAHNPAVFANTELWDRAVAVINDMGLHRVETVELKKV